MKPRIAVFSGATATIANTAPLVTSNKARKRQGVPLLTDADGSEHRFDALRPQRLAAPVTVYIEAFSGHPMELDAAELYGPPDGYLDAKGSFRLERTRDDDRPVFRVTLEPSDGLYPLPYMALQASGVPWEDDTTEPGAPPESTRQPYFPDGSRLFEEIDRLGVSREGHAGRLSAMAEFDFYRAAPPSGYRHGLPAAQRTDLGDGDIPPEVFAEDYFPYRPRHQATEPHSVTLSRITNMVARALSSGRYAGAIWLEGSPSVEETTYWLHLLMDTDVPIVGNASQRVHGEVSNDGDRNIIDGVHYIVSRIWADADGRDSVGAVLVQDEQIFTSREAQKADARPGGYTATGGHGGVIGTMGDPGPPRLTFRPVRLHTYRSEVTLSRLPDRVAALPAHPGDRARQLDVKDANGDLRAEAIPVVTITKHGRYGSREMDEALEVMTRLERSHERPFLGGFVAEGTAPFAKTPGAVDEALRRATLSGMPVVRVGRGNAEGMVPPDRTGLGISGNNLTSIKARLLLMACLLRLGALPPCADPEAPTPAELEAIRAKVGEYQAIFDTH